MSIAQEQPRIDAKAVVWTVVVHALLFLLLFLINYNVPELEPMGDMGIEVNLGTAADGYGTSQPMAIGNPAPQNGSQPQMNNSSNATLPANMLDSDYPDAPAINNTENARNSDNSNRVNSNKTNNSTNTANVPKPPRPKYQYTGAAGDGGNNAGSNQSGSSEGNTTGNEDRGVPGGTAGADNYEGIPGNGGFNFNLKDRHIVATPSPDAEFKESGKVRIRITVNRAGVITNQYIISASNTQLRNIALEKVKGIRFNKSTSAPIEQRGSITFVFKTRS